MSNKRYRFTFEPNDEHLQHGAHKYIKKVMKNGKWVYEYAKDKLGYDERDAYRKAAQKEKAAINSFYDVQKRNAAANKAGNMGGRIPAGQVAQGKAVRKKARDKASAAYREAATELDAAKKAYDKTALAKVEKASSATKKAINKGAKKAAKALKKASVNAKSKWIGYTKPALKKAAKKAKKDASIAYRRAKFKIKKAMNKNK